MKRYRLSISILILVVLMVLAMGFRRIDLRVKRHSDCLGTFGTCCSKFHSAPSTRGRLPTRKGTSDPVQHLRQLRDRSVWSNNVVGIDHVPIAVRNLDSAAALYRKLGFTLKPGRAHPNGIRNQHVKFSNGTELELITASQPLDTLTREYCDFLKAGEGPAFFGLYTTNSSALAKQLDGYRNYERDGGYITFPATDLLHPLFFGGRNISPTDKPEHFAHRNGAFSLIGVWVATDDAADFVQLFKRIGIPVGQQKMQGPFAHADAQVAALKEGEVIFVPGSFQTVRGHEVVGATLQVYNIDTVKVALRRAGIGVFTVARRENGMASLFLSPEVTHGMWLEFREV